MKGFIDYNIDYVIKFGGSILEDFEACQKTVKAISQLPALGVKVLVVPGGGPTDNTIERLDKTAHFVPFTHHKACARAQDQTGLMICDPVFGDTFTPCQTFEEVNEATAAGKVPVLLPSYTIFACDPFERCWEITSDAMAAWSSWFVHSKNIIIITNVDGVYPSDKIGQEGALITEISATDLMKYGHNAVDACTAPFLKENGINCWIVNGSSPERIIDIVQGKKTIGTFIKGE